MKKALMLLTLTLCLIVSAGYVFAEEMPKEGTESGIVAYSSSVAVMMMGKDLQVTFDALGVFVTDSPDSPFANASVRILGSGLVLKGVYTEVGSICFTIPNGDQAFFTYEGEGYAANKVLGKMTCTGGTGKFAGITGEGEFDRLNVTKPAQKGTSQGYSKSKFSWKIAKAE